MLKKILIGFLINTTIVFPINEKEENPNVFLLTEQLTENFNNSNKLIIEETKELHKKVLKDYREKERLRLEEEKKRIYCTFHITYYTNLPSCTGNTHGITKSGTYPKRGTVAAPDELPFNTKIYLNNGSIFNVEDRGNPKNIYVGKDGIIRLDVFVERLAGEGDSAYKKRALSYGEDFIDGYYKIEE